MLLQEGLFRIYDPEARWDDVYAQLRRGESPVDDEGNLRGVAIRFDGMRYLEFHEDRPGLTIGYAKGETVQTCFLDLQSPAMRDELIAALVAATGGEAVKGDRELGFWQAVWPPSLSLAAVMLAAAVLAAAARPGGYSKDPLLKFLRWAGPSGVLAAFALPSLLLFVWLIKRAMFPPRVEVLQLRGA